MKRNLFMSTCLLSCVLFAGCGNNHNTITDLQGTTDASQIMEDTEITYTIDNIPVYSGYICIPIDNDVPSFSSSEYKTNGTYMAIYELDDLGHKKGADCIIDETMISDHEEAGEPYFIPLYLGGEDKDTNRIEISNETYEQMSVSYEEIYNHIKTTEWARVIVKAEPVYDGDQLLGIHLMYASMEDEGEALSRNLFFYNTDYVL